MSNEGSSGQSYTLEQLLEFKKTYIPNKIEFTTTQRSNFKVVNEIANVSYDAPVLDRSSRAFHSSDKMDQRGEGDKNTESGNYKEAQKCFNAASNKNAALVAKRMNELTGPDNSVQLIIKATITNSSDYPEKSLVQYVAWMEVCAAFYQINQQIKDKIIQATKDRLNDFLPSPLAGQKVNLEAGKLRFIQSAGCWLSCLLRIGFLSVKEYCDIIVNVRNQISFENQIHFLVSTLTVAGPYFDCRTEPILEISFLYSYLHFLVGTKKLPTRITTSAIDLFEFRAQGWGLNYYQLQSEFAEYRNNNQRPVPKFLFDNKERTLRSIFCISKDISNEKYQFIEFATNVLSQVFHDFNEFLEIYNKKKFDINEFIIDIHNPHILSNYFDIIYNIIAKLYVKFLNNVPNGDKSFESYILKMFEIYPNQLLIQRIVVPTPPKFSEIIMNPEIFEQDENSNISIEACNRILKNFPENQSEYNEFVFGQINEPTPEDENDETAPEEDNDSLPSFWSFLRQLYFYVQYPSEQVDNYLNSQKASKSNWSIQNRLLGLYTLFSNFATTYQEDEEVDIGQKYTEEINKEELTFYLGNIDNNIKDYLVKTALRILMDEDILTDERMNTIYEITIRDLLGSQ